MIRKGKILIIDDDRRFREALARRLDSQGYVPHVCSTAVEGLAAVDEQRWDLVVTEARLNGAAGEGLPSRIKTLHPELPVIVVTSHPSVEDAVRCLKAGAEEYFTRKVDFAELLRAVELALERSRAQRELERLRTNLKEVSPVSELVGRSAAMVRVREQVETVAGTDATVLITGERGTGKEIVARAIHAGSPRSQMPLVVVRCGSLPEELLEEELFGREAPAEVAHGAKKGKFEIADGGTVFLDEISEVSPRLQAELLNVMETREVFRLGGSKPVRVDFRWIAASNRRLDALVREGRFRSELFYRLNVFTIELPPLRERREDIPLLVDHFLRKYATLMNRPAPKVSQRAMDLLLAHSWPGNVRELENAVERAMLISNGGEIKRSHLPFQLEQRKEEEGLSLAEVERRHIERVVEHTGWNLSRAARILKIDRTTLYNKLRRYGLR